MGVTTHIISEKMLTLTLLLVSAVCASQIDQDLLEDEERTLGGLALDAGVSAQQKAITYKSAGDYTLVSIPWSGATALAFNDTTAATLSTVGNAALLLGGLYLLSGFPVALAKSDPLGISRRFGKPAPPPKFYKKQQKKPEIKKRKLSMPRQHRPVHIERRGPGERFHAEERQMPVAEERQLQQLPQIQRPRLPQLPSLRPLQFRMPQLPKFNIPSLPGLRRPSRPQPAGRPQAAPAPAGRPQSSPASAPRPQPVQPVPASRPVTVARPVTASAPVFRPQTPAATRRPVVSQTVRPASVIAPVQTSPAQSRPAQSRPVQPEPQPSRPVAPLADFGSSPFDSDPFSEFQNSDFGNEESFRDLIAAQFGDSFDLKRLPETK